MARANELEGLTDRQRQAVLLGAEALKARQDFNRKSFDQWMVIAHGVVPLCQLAEGMARKARQHLLKNQGYGSLNPSTVSRLLLMVAHETAVRIFRDGLTQNKRDSWNSPTSLCNRCPDLRKAIADAKAAKEAETGKPHKPRKPTNRVLVVERAIDAITDYGHGLEDADQRAVLVERLHKLADGLAGPTEPPTNPKAQRKAKATVTTPPTSERPAKAMIAGAELTWTQDKNENGFFGHAHFNYTAQSAPGYYSIRPAYDFQGSGRFIDYKVERYQTATSTEKDRRKLGSARTVKRAKEIAQKHHAKQAAASDAPAQLKRQAETELTASPSISVPSFNTDRIDKINAKLAAQNERIELTKKGIWRRMRSTNPDGKSPRWVVIEKNISLFELANELKFET